MSSVKYPNLTKEMAVRKITNTSIAELLNIHINSVSYKLSKVFNDNFGCPIIKTRLGY